MRQQVQDIVSDIMHSPFVVGFAGALVGVIVRGKLSFLAKLSMLTVGAVSATYLAPGIARWSGIESLEYLSVIAFVIGVIGLQIMGGLIKLGEDIKDNPDKYLPWKWKK